MGSELALYYVAVYYSDMSIWIDGIPVAEKSLLDRVLEVRGLHSSAEREAFLKPSYEEGLHSPFCFAQMEYATKRLESAIRNKEKICIFGDYDVDGVTATALLYRLFSFLQAGELLPILPHRVDDGYGLNRKGVDQAHEFGASLLVTVDNGIVAHEEVAYAAELGIDVIITDHHLPGKSLPAAYAIIDPWVEQDCPFRELSGVGVAYKLATALLQRFPEVKGGNAFLKWSLDLVALGTVADVMSLRDENRVLVHYGLKVIPKSKLPGLRALLETAQVEQYDTEMIGYRLGPRINAAGRLDSAEQAFWLMVSEETHEAAEIALALEKLNRQRQSMVKTALVDAKAQAEQQIDKGESVLVVRSSKWHPGIIGLLAGRLSEAHGCPAVVMTNAEDSSHYVASCRSIPQFDIADAIAAFEQYFTRSGGHAQAGGFTMPVENLALFEEQFFSYGKERLAGQRAVREHAIDCDVRLDELTLDNCHVLQWMQPFGEGNPEPLLCLRQVSLTECRKVGSTGAHLRVGVRTAGGVVYGIGFSLGEKMDQLQGQDSVDLLFYLRINNYQGRKSPQMNLVDIRTAVS